VFIAPFVIYAGAAVAIFAALRPFSPPRRLRSRLNQSADRRTEPLRRDPRAADRAVLKRAIPATTKLPLTPANNSGGRASTRRFKVAPERAVETSRSLGEVRSVHAQGSGHPGPGSLCCPPRMRRRARKIRAMLGPLRSAIANRHRPRLGTTRGLRKIA
jgi:hypothetical protein